MQGPKRPRNAEEARDDENDDDDIPPAPGVIFDSVASVVGEDEATESDSHHQPSQEAAAQGLGPSRSAVEEFIIFESCELATQRGVQ